MDVEHSIIQSYLALMRCYPKGYQEAYAEELEYAIRQAAESAAQEGRIALFRLAWRELRDLPCAALRAHWRERRGMMLKTRPGTYLPGGPLAWWMLVGVFTPFLLAAIAADLSSSIWRLPGWANWLGAALGFLGLGVLILTWIFGLVKGFPDWSLPSLGSGFFVLTYLLDGGVGRILEFFNVINWPDSTWQRILVSIQRSFLFLLPAAAMAVIVLLLFKPFYRRVRQEWSLLSFLFLGVAIPPFIMNDPYQHLAPFEIAALLTLAIGAWIFLKWRTAWQRLATLLLAVILATCIYAVGIYLVYPLEDWAQISSFPRWWEAIYPLMGAPAILVLISLPAVFGLFPKAEPDGV